MDSFEWNKIAGAVLGTLLFVVAVKIASEMIFEVPMPLKPGYVVQGVPAASSGAGPAQPAEEPLPDFGTVLAKADVAKGQQVSQRCQQCHDLGKGGPDKIGPNLWGIVGRPRASRSSFSYSSAMSSSHAPWMFDELFRYLKSPQAVVPGTKMSFAGLPSAQDRINLIAWLRTQSDSPVPIPPPAPAGASKAPAGGKASPAVPAKPGSPAKATPPTK
jgi:cytochrome c